VYNGLISGVSLTGDRFFYVNPLASSGNHHRVPWFGTSCCPTNIVRFLPGIGERVYALRGNTIWTVLYLSNTAKIPLDGGKVTLTQTTNYPWDGNMQITVDPEASFAFTLSLRIPGWCRSKPSITVNGQPVEQVNVDKGYVPIARTWNRGDVVRLNLPMPVERIYADPHVKADVGRVALQRGPVVYCLEGVDNNGTIRNLVLPNDAKLTTSFDKEGPLGGAVSIHGEALAVSMNAQNQRVTHPVRFRAVPYCTWDNREPGPMVVWLPETPDIADLPVGQGVIARGVRIQASHLYANDSLEALNDEHLPKSSKDHSIPRMTWWDHKGSTEWVSYSFPTPQSISECSVYWFDDTGIGQCRVPAAWRLLWLDDTTWKPVKLTARARYETTLDTFNRITFAPVTTREVKLEVKLQAGFSGGILQWDMADRK
jgi:hypothetical protein